MVQLLFNLARSIRPRQALKNLSILAPLVFSGNLFNPEKILSSLWCVFIFTIMTSAVYLINDIIDLPRDQLHPFKRKRPIASGKLPVPTAVFFAVTSVVLSLYLAINHNFFFFLATLFYLLLQLGYSFWLKNVIVLDVLLIAAGFIIRVYAGALAINVHMSVWFLLCVVSLALFLAAGKRRAELAILTEKAVPKHRRTLTFYTPQLLDSYLAMFANSAWLAYALFTFFAPTPVISQQITMLSQLPLTFAGIGKWLMITIPIVIFGLMRYMNTIYQGSRAESPERVLLSDKPLMATVIVWGIMVILIIYGIN